MKLRSVIPSVLLLLAQAPIARSVFLAGTEAREMWTEVLQGVRFPSDTALAIRFGILIPVGVAVLSIVLGILAWRRKKSFLGSLFGLAVGEAVLLALFAFALVEPSMVITWRMGP